MYKYTRGPINLEEAVIENENRQLGKRYGDDVDYIVGKSDLSKLALAGETAAEERFGTDEDSFPGKG